MVQIALGALALALLLPLAATAFISTGPNYDRSWYWQNPRPQGNDLVAQSWVDANTGYVAGAGGTLLKTVDGGSSWQTYDASATTRLTGASFVDASNGWLVGYGGLVRHTTNGATTWTSQNPDGSTNLQAVNAWDANTAVTVGDAGATTSTIFYTRNAGATWNASTANQTAPLKGVAMMSASTVWAVGSGGAMLKSTDGGASWVTQSSPVSVGLNAVAFAKGSTIGYAVGNANGSALTVLRTTDGSTWTQVATLPSGTNNLYGVAAYSTGTLAGTTVMISGDNGAIYKSSDGGATWTNEAQTRLSGMSIRAISVLSATAARASGDAGTLLNTSDAGVTWSSAMPNSTSNHQATCFTDANNGWAVGSAGSIMHTTDAGNTWQSLTVGTGTLRSVVVTMSGGQTLGWAVGDGGQIWHTTDGLNWSAQNTTSSAQLNGVCFTTATTGTIVGAAGTVLRTGNGGTTWTAITPPTAQSLNAVWYADTSNGFAVGNNGTALKTTNGGATWVAMTTNVTANLWCVHGAAVNRLFAGGDAGTFIWHKTAIGNNNWVDRTASSGTTQAIHSIFFADVNNGWYGGYYGTVARTTNAGTLWTAQNAGISTSTVDPSISANDIYFTSATNGYLVGDNGVIRHTTNSGTAWTSLQYGTYSQVNGIAFTDATNGWAAGQSGNVFHTSDGGNSWWIQKSGSSQDMYAVSMATSSTGWVVGGMGEIRKTTNGGSTWVHQDGTSTASYRAIAMFDATHLIVGGDGGLVKYTANGSTWTTGTMASAQQIDALATTTANTAFLGTGYTSGDATTLYKTTNAGSTWAAVPWSAITPAVPVGQIYALSFPDSSDGFAAMANGVVLKTTNGGTSWTSISTPLAGSSLLAIYFYDYKHGWAVGSGGAIERTSDGGSTWQVEQSGTNTRALRAVRFLDLNHGWVAGDSGTILRTTNQSPPTTLITITPSSPNGGNGWYVTTPQISLSTSPTATSYYSWTSAGGPFVSYSATLTASEGIPTLNYYSMLPGGEQESLQQYTLNVDLTPPTVPTGLAASSVSTSSLTLAWSPSSDALSGVDHYDVLVNGVVARSASTTSASLAGLTPNATYLLTVRAVDAAGQISSPSSPLSVTMLDVERSPLVTTLSLSPSTPNGTNGWYSSTPTITLTSQPASAPAATYYSIDSSTGPWTAYSGPFPAPSGSHLVSFYSTDTTGFRNPETVNTVQVQVDPAGTSSVASVTALPTSAWSIHLAWTPGALPLSGIDHYAIYENGSVLATSALPSYDANFLSPNHTYTFSVTAVSGAGVESAMSPTVNATTLLALLPSPPTHVVGQSVGGNAVFVNWQPQAAADSSGSVTYHIWRSTDGQNYTQLASVVGQASSTYADTGLSSSTRYYYAVSIQDARGESSLSDTSSANAVYAAPVTGKPQRTTGLAAIAGSDSVLLTWQPNSNPAVTGYVVVRGDRSLDPAPTILTTVSISPTNYTDTSAVNGQTYFYTVYAVDAMGVQSYPSLEVKAQPHQAVSQLSAVNPHLFSSAGFSLTCSQCHSPHDVPAGTPSLFTERGPNVDPTCLRCHSLNSGLASTDTSSEIGDALNQSGLPIWTNQNTAGSLTCDGCHRSLSDETTATAGLIAVGGSGMIHAGGAQGDNACYVCHGSGSTLTYGDMSGFESSGHSAVPAPTSGSNIKCEACHDAHASRNTHLTTYAGPMVCLQCHTTASTDPNQTDIWSDLTLNADANAKHPIMPQDQASGARLSCQNCHSTHSGTAQYPLVDPGDPSPSGKWTGDTNTFCLTCHDGEPLPTQTQTQPWADAVLGRSAATTLPDILDAYAANVHGSASAADTTTTNTYLRADMGYSAGVTLDCTACHDPHGSSNNFTLSPQVKSANGAKTVSSLLVYKIPAGSITPTSPVGYDMRFFCSSCHDFDPATHDPMAGTDSTQFGKTDCTSCHSHTNADGSPSSGL